MKRTNLLTLLTIAMLLVACTPSEPEVSPTDPEITEQPSTPEPEETTPDADEPTYEITGEQATAPEADVLAGMHLVMAGDTPPKPTAYKLPTCKVGTDWATPPTSKSGNSSSWTST